MGNKILLTGKHHPILISTLQENGFEVNFIESIDKIKTDFSVYQGLIISNNFPISESIIEKSTQLKFIGRLGSGLEIIDLNAAKMRNIKVFNSPEGNANAVGEHALGMLLTLLHNIQKSNLELLQGVFERVKNTGTELAHMTVGIIGYGNNGADFAYKLASLGVKVLAYDILPKIADHLNIEIVKDMNAIYKNADCISLHIPLNESTLHYIDDQLVNKIEKNFILINCARGKLVNTKSLYKGLKSGKISGACIDVWEEEPLTNFDDEHKKLVDEIIGMDNVIATPHIAGYSHQANYKMSKILAEKIVSSMKN